MAGTFRYRGGENVLAYRVESLPCDYHVNNGAQIGYWAVLNMDGTLFTYQTNESFLRTFEPIDAEAQAIYVDASFEKSLPGG